MHTIFIPEDCSSHCSDAALYSLLQYYNQEYEAYSIKYFYTDYYCRSSKNKTISICRGKYNSDTMMDIYGFTIEYKDLIEESSLKMIVDTSLNNQPIGAVVDPYFCYWSPFYHASHNLHTILIVDIDEASKQYVVFDTHFNATGYVRADIETINACAKRYFLFKQTEKRAIGVEPFIQILGKQVSDFDSRTVVKSNELLDYIITTDRRVLFPEKLETSELLINLLWIAEDKRHFPVALRLIEEKSKTNAFASVYSLLDRSEHCFIVLKSLLTKYAISGAAQTDKMRSIIDEIYTIDAETVDELKDAIKRLGYR